VQFIQTNKKILLEKPCRTGVNPIRLLVSKFTHSFSE